MSTSISAISRGSLCSASPIVLWSHLFVRVAGRPTSRLDRECSEILRNCENTLADVKRSYF